jgi:exodeoxyribonuclease-5
MTQTIQWSPQQVSALDAIEQWFHDPCSDQVFKLFGYAGTGKTSLAQEAADRIGGMVLFGAYTGKAAHVLKTKGCPNATTIHKTVYKVNKPDRAKLLTLEAQLHNADDEEAEMLKVEIEKEKERLEQPRFSINLDSSLNHASVMIVDEVSMVDKKIGRDLLSFGKKILVLGDPGQLPPVKGTGFFNADPDIVLTEIHRQAGDNPIIQLATKARNGERIKVGEYGDSVVRMGEPPVEDFLNADQILVGTNALRTKVNFAIRHHKGFAPERPAAGDKIVCLKNNHEAGLLNGQLWEVVSILETQYGNSDDHIAMRIRNDEDREMDVISHLHHFQDRPGKLNFYTAGDSEWFDYGYALTVHKAQGSQWNNVIVFDQSKVFRENRSKWLYTAITRAAEKVTLLRS